MLEKLIEYLDLPDSDYWYDVGSCIARRIIDENADAILQNIIREWRFWPENRQEHLAYILGDSSSDGEVFLINDMLGAESKNVVFRAREALESLRLKT